MQEVSCFPKFSFIIKNMKTTKIFLGFIFLLSLVFVQNFQAQNNQYPNELNGYQFFGKGRLAGLKPGVSTKEDVKRIFGKNCEKICDYDSDWTVNFSFYENNWTKEDTDEKGVKTVYYLEPKYLEKLRKIEITPKKQQSFANVSFPNAFQKLMRSQITKNRSGKGRMITYESFQDANGLVYELYSATDYDDIKNKNERLYNKGDLFSIQYNISKEQEKVMYTLKKIK
jgi:hypothetical protein